MWENSQQRKQKHGKTLSIMEFIGLTLKYRQIKTIWAGLKPVPTFFEEDGIFVHYDEQIPQILFSMMNKI